MAFEISQIINKYLQDIAIVVDKNNDGVISDGTEVSVFLEKSKNLVETGLCTEAEYTEILGYCPREVNTRGGKITIGTKKFVPNQNVQKAYLEQLNSEIDKELKSRNLERTPENISKVTGIIKTKKDLNVQIKIQESKIEKLKQQKPTDKSESRKEIATATSMTAGALGGAWAGFKLGSPFGPKGMIIGAFIGGIVGSFAGGFGGLAIANATISEGDKKAAQEEIKKEIAAEEKTLKKLREEYKKLG